MFEKRRRGGGGEILKTKAVIKKYEKNFFAATFQRIVHALTTGLLHQAYRFLGGVLLVKLLIMYWLV